MLGVIAIYIGIMRLGSVNHYQTWSLEADPNKQVLVKNLLSEGAAKALGLGLSDSYCRHFRQSGN